MRKLLFLINPYAGTRKANKILPDILTVFNRAGYETWVYVTQFPGDGKRVVQQRAKDVDLVVCCGGDGTFNETVEGILSSGVEIPVGYIPAGSTNDFAAGLGLPNDPVEAAKQIAKGSPERYDVGCFGGRYFTYVASFGAFTKASYSTPQNIKNALGHTAYILGGIQELSQIHAIHARLELEGETIEDDFLFGAICNSTSLGGILTLDPRQVDMRDGMFEILLIRAPRDLAEIAECIQAVQKQVYNCKMITFRSTRQVRITIDREIPWTLDGERENGHEEVTVQNVHHAIQLIR